MCNSCRSLFETEDSGCIFLHHEQVPLSLARFSATWARSHGIFYTKRIKWQMQAYQEKPAVFLDGIQHARTFCAVCGRWGKGSSLG